jgi:hypothetical protein
VLASLPSPHSATPCRGVLPLPFSSIDLDSQASVRLHHESGALTLLVFFICDSLEPLFKSLYSFFRRSFVCYYSKKTKLLCCQK